MIKRLLRSNITIALMALVMVVAVTLALAATAGAGGDTVTVYVTISDKGEFATGADGEPMAYMPVEVSADNPNIDDVLRAAHEAYYTGGAEEGYASSEGVWGLSLDRLWGDTSHSFGYYLNNAAAWSLEDPVGDGDYVYAFVYSDPSYSDQYTYFTQPVQTVTVGETLDLTLTTGYWQGSDYEEAPLAGAAITVDGEDTGKETSAGGETSLVFAAAGTYLVSAAAPAGVIITPPVCIVEVEAPEAITVRVSAQEAGSFLFQQQEVTVEYGIAQAYGYANSAPPGTITALDALVAAHIAAFDDADFTPDTATGYLTMLSGTPVSMFGNGAGGKYSGFAVNHTYYKDEEDNGYLVNTAPIADGDILEFFYYEDASWLDHLTWFVDEQGSPIDAVTVEAGDNILLRLKGFLYMFGYSGTPGPYGTNSDIYSEDGAIYIVEGNGLDGELIGTPTSAAGITAAFADPGVYYLTAYGYENDYEAQIICPTLIVNVLARNTENDFTGLSVNNYSLSPEFKPAVRSYGLTTDIPAGTSASASITVKSTFPSGSSATYSYVQRNGNTNSGSLTSGGGSSLTNLKAGATVINFVVTTPEGVAKSYQLTVKRETALSALNLTQSGQAVAVTAGEAGSYTAQALTGTDIVITPAAGGDADNTRITVNGAAPAASYPIQAGANTFTVTATSADGVMSKDYTLTVTGVSPALCQFTVTPADAILRLYDVMGNELAPSAGASYNNLLTGVEYTYNASKTGYQAERGTITAGTDTEKTITLALAGGQPEEVAAQWKNFRNSDAHMAVTSAYTPRTAGEAALKWVTAETLISGFTGPSPFLIIDDYLITTKGASLVKINKSSGAVAATGTMAAMVGALGNVAPTYGGGMIFVPLTNGQVQAFNAKTLNALWISQSLGSQCTTPLVYSDGYVYGSTGNFANAKFFALSATDENTASGSETKYATWTVDASAYSGSYWSGALVTDNTVIYGTDAVSGDSQLFSRDKYTGQLISQITLSGLGGQRSSIAYYNGRAYFTTLGGYLCSVAVNASGQLSDLKSQRATGATHSTSTPVIYNGVVYYGVNGKLIAANAGSLATLRSVAFPSAANVQASPLLSTARAADGEIYLYVTQNDKPGCIYAVRDNGATLALETLYTPGTTDQSIFSIICDSDGTLYYRNDAGYVIAVAAKYAVDITENPNGGIRVDKSGAAAGETVTIDISANYGWLPDAVYLDGEPLADQDGVYSFTMGHEPVTVSADFVSDPNAGQIRLVAPMVDAGAISADLRAAITTALDGISISGLTGAANSHLAGVIAAYQNNPLYQQAIIDIELYLDIKVTGAETDSSGKITSLILEIKPMYQVLADNVKAGSPIAIQNSQLSGNMTITLPLPANMTASHPRIKHNGVTIIPAVRDGNLVFTTSSFSELQIIANGVLDSVAYRLNGGTLSGVSDRETVTYYLEDDGNKLPIPKRSGYSFNGWYANSAFSGSEYTTINSNLPGTLYAEWIAAGIEVSFRLIGDHAHGSSGHSNYFTWLATREYTIPEDSTVEDLIITALKDAGLSHTLRNGYLAAVENPLTGKKLAEQDNGANSGWMYAVNKVEPTEGINQYVLEDGDQVIVFYTDDYTKAYNGFSVADVDPDSGSLKKELKSLISKAEGVLDKTAEANGPEGLANGEYWAGAAAFNRLEAAIKDAQAVYDNKKADADDYADAIADLRQAIDDFNAARQQAGASPDFLDVPAGHWAYSHIASLSQRGVINGYGNGYFGVNDPIRRCDFVLMLSRLSGKTMPAAGARFSDLNVADPNAAAITWAADAAIVNGYSDGRFGPQDYITRQDIAAILYRYSNYMGTIMPQAQAAIAFSDQAAISDYARAPVSAMQRAGIINGIGGNRFAPRANATRGQVAKMLYLLDALD